MTAQINNLWISNQKAFGWLLEDLHMLADGHMIERFQISSSLTDNEVIEVIKEQNW